MGNCGEAMDDDLNMPEALSVIFNMITSLNKTVNEKGADESDLKLIIETMDKFDTVLGLGSIEIWKPLSEASDEVKKLIEQREKHRKEKNWEKADEIRNKLKEIGITIEDSKQGPKWTSNQD